MWTTWLFVQVGEKVKYYISSTVNFGRTALLPIRRAELAQDQVQWKSGSAKCVQCRIQTGWYERTMLSLITHTPCPMSPYCSYVHGVSDTALTLIFLKDTVCSLIGTQTHKPPLTLVYHMFLVHCTSLDLLLTIQLFW